MRVLPESLLIYGIEIDIRALIGVLAIMGLIAFAEFMPRYLKFRDEVHGDNDAPKYAPHWAKVKYLALPVLIMFGLDTFLDIKDDGVDPIVIAGEAPVKAEEPVVEEAPVAAVDTTPKEPDHPGKALFTAKACASCHSVQENVKIVGPSLFKVFGRSGVVVTAGKERNIKVDEAYLTSSIMEPAKDLVKGYGNLMPSQKGMLTPAELKTLIAYLKTL